MNEIKLGSLHDLFGENLYIQLKPKENNFIKPYKNIVIVFDEEQIIIPVEQLFKKLKELFKENKDE